MKRYAHFFDFVFNTFIFKDRKGGLIHSYAVVPSAPVSTPLTKLSFVGTGALPLMPPCTPLHPIGVQVGGIYLHPFAPLWGAWGEGGIRGTARLCKVRKRYQLSSGRVMRKYIALICSHRHVFCFVKKCRGNV